MAGPGASIPQHESRPEKLLTNESRQYILTNGDNNIVEDSQIYPDDQQFATHTDIVGVVRAVVPFVG